MPSLDKYEVKHKERRYDGYVKVDCMQVAIDDKDVQLEVVERGESVSLLIIDPDTHDCLVTRQFRPATASIMDGPVAGMIDENESETTAIIRELREETGIALSEDALIRCGRFYLSAGVMTEATTCFVAKMSLSELSFPYAVSNPDESEFLEVDIAPLSDILADDNKQASLALCALFAEKLIK